MSFFALVLALANLTDRPCCGVAPAKPFTTHGQSSEHGTLVRGHALVFSAAAAVSFALFFCFTACSRQLYLVRWVIVHVH